MLSGKSALVTGASRGIGKAIALELASHGANVAVNYAGNKEKAEEVVEQIKEMNVEAFAIQADVSKEKDVQTMVKEVIDAFGQIDILVNNAGITKDQLIMRMKTEDFNQVIETNLTGTFLCTKAVT